VGDLLAYTGVLGESKRDLDALFRGEEISENSRFFRPILRAEFIAKSRPHLRAGMDISDGLFCDTNKLLEINTLGFESLAEIKDEIGLSGEEYEMLIAFCPKEREAIEKVAKETNTPLTIFARVEENKYRFACKSHHFSTEIEM
jgi:thiamine-monophosphate kinase